jgi:hypothetical protein
MAEPHENELAHRALEPSSADVLRGLAAPAARIVGDAASILEEELAMGIAAAKKVEARLINVTQVRQSEDTLEVLRRFRHDAHEIVDILMDLVSVATAAANTMTKRLITIQAGTSSSDLNGSQGIPMLRVASAREGAIAEISMSIANSSESATGVLRPTATDLLGARGGSLPARTISFLPADVTIGPNAQEKIAVRASIPAGTPPGLYSGLVQVAGMEGLRAVLVVDVTGVAETTQPSPPARERERPTRTSRPRHR